MFNMAGDAGTGRPEAVLASDEPKQQTDRAAGAVAQLVAELLDEYGLDAAFVARSAGLASADHVERVRWGAEVSSAVAMLLRMLHGRATRGDLPLSRSRAADQKRVEETTSRSDSAAEVADKASMRPTGSPARNPRERRGQADEGADSSAALKRRRRVRRATPDQIRDFLDLSAWLRERGHSDTQIATEARLNDRISLTDAVSGLNVYQLRMLRRHVESTGGNPETILAEKRGRALAMQREREAAVREQPEEQAAEPSERAPAPTAPEQPEQTPAGKTPSSRAEHSTETTPQSELPTQPPSPDESERPAQTPVRSQTFHGERKAVDAQVDIRVRPAEHPQLPAPATASSEIGGRPAPSPFGVAGEARIDAGSEPTTTARLQPPASDHERHPGPVAEPAGDVPEARLRTLLFDFALDIVDAQTPADLVGVISRLDERIGSAVDILTDPSDGS